MIRIPDAGRFELRLADGAANPYLLQASMLAAGLDGIANRRHPGARLDIDMYAARDSAPPEIRSLPLNLLDALRALEASPVFKASFGDQMVASYVKLKHAEWNEYCRHLTDWERHATLDC
jgi:glutamine synthetase